MTMEWRVRALPLLLAVAVGVAPPAMIPPPVQPAALPSHAVVSQMDATKVAMVAAPAAFPASNEQVVPRLRGQSPTGTNFVTALQGSPPKGANDLFRETHNHQELSQRSNAPQPSLNGRAGSLGALLFAAVAAAVAGGSWWRKRAEAVKNMESATEMIASSSIQVEYPKFSVAALASEKPFDPIGLMSTAPRRDVLGTIAAASLLAVAPSPAQADNMGEPARALKKYGTAVLKLEESVEKGDLAALKPKLRKFDLLSGAYRNSPAKLDKVTDMTSKIIDAVEAGDVKTVQTEYKALLEFTQLKVVLPNMPAPKGARIVDTSSSIAGTAKLTNVKEN